MSDASVERLLGDLKGGMGKIEGQLAGLTKSVEDSWKSRRQIYDELGQLKSTVQDCNAQIKAMQVCVNQMKPIIQEHERLKNKGLGMLVGAAIAGGGAATLLQKLLSKIGIGG